MIDGSLNTYCELKLVFLEWRPLDTFQILFRYVSMFQFSGRQYFEMDGVYIKLKVSRLRAFHSLVSHKGAQALCTNYREFRYCFAYYERFKDLVCEIQQLLKRRNISMNFEINCTYGNLGLLLLFLCNLGLIHDYFIRFCSSLFVRCCFPTLKEKQGR